MMLIRTTLPIAALTGKLCDIEHGHPPHRINPAEPDSATCRGRPAAKRTWPQPTKLGLKDADPSEQELLTIANEEALKDNTATWAREIEGGTRAVFIAVTGGL